MLYLGDCIEVLRAHGDNSVDACVTDPPYGLSFMGKKWDYDVPSVEVWREVFRVLKPGGHLLAFGGTRTYHRLAVNVEDAGFEIRDQIQWLYGQGFPKSLNIGLSADKAAGLSGDRGTAIKRGVNNLASQVLSGSETPKYEGKTDFAKQWEGWGTALKPSFEPLVLAVKPLTGAGLVDSLVHECQSKLLVLIAKKYSASNQSVSDAAASIAQWNVEKNTHTPEGLSGAMATLRSESATTSSLSTELSWLDTLAAISLHVSTCTTETVTSLTTDLRTLKFLLSKSIQEGTIQEEIGQSGDSSSALLVGSLFTALSFKLNCILTHSVLESVSAADAVKSFHPDANPIVLARKPLEKGLTVAQNVQKWGTGAINVDGCRIGTQDVLSIGSGKIALDKSGTGFDNYTNPGKQNSLGRFPANVLLDETAAAALDEQVGYLAGAGNKIGSKKKAGSHFGNEQTQMNLKYDNGGSASRFFYCAKASTSERNAGLDGMAEKFSATMNNGIGHREHDPNDPKAYKRNFHPTVKPIRLMEYLCRLITPPGGIVLDPFMGSGTTGIAAKRLGFEFLGIELNPEYFEIATKRIENAKPDEVAPDPQLTIAEVSHA